MFLNNYFTSIAKIIREQTLISNFYQNMTQTTYLILTQIPFWKIKCLLYDSHKSSGPNSIPLKSLKLLKNDISQQRSDIFNTAFLTGQFSSVLKIARVIPIHQKQSKVDYINYRPISLLSNIEKVNEKLMYKRLFNFLGIISVIHLLQFDFQPKYSTRHMLWLSLLRVLGKL